MITNVTKSGIFTVSLDLELYWGVGDHRSLSDYSANLSKVEYVTDEMLKIFKKFGVHCTWATVGVLMLQTKEKLINFLSEEGFSEELKNEFPFNYIQTNQLEPKFHFLDNVAERLIKVPGQEFASHTFSHFYCHKPGQQIEFFEKEMQASVKLAKQCGSQFKSFVFPRNQIHGPFFEVLKSTGIESYRGNPKHWAYQIKQNDRLRVCRRMIKLLDAYINVTGKDSYPLAEVIESSGLNNIKASRFLRPHNKRLWLNKLKKRRIFGSLKEAATNGKVYHLWWHPHNFGENTEENLKDLEEICSYYAELCESHKMQSLNMSEIAELVSNV